jgi:hypothetical protein
VRCPVQQRRDVRAADELPGRMVRGRLLSLGVHTRVGPRDERLAWSGLGGGAPAFQCSLGLRRLVSLIAHDRVGARWQSCRRMGKRAHGDVGAA